MIGAIIGDIVGSRFEFNNYRSKDFEFFGSDCTFTDDTVCTVAVADWILNSHEYGLTSGQRASLIIQKWCIKYPGRGYGLMFLNWINDAKPYNSFGNGAGMRISPVGLFFDNETDLFKYSDMVTAISHNHPEGLKGARAIALCMFLGRSGSSKTEIKERISSEFGYNLNQKCDVISKTNTFDETCQVTVPQAITAFLESTDFEDAIRLAVSIGGDTDTIAAMTGAIAEAYYKEIPAQIIKHVLSILPPEMVKVISEFYKLVSIGTGYDYILNF